MELVVILLLSAVVCVPLTQLLGLGVIPGYLLAGIVIGPSGLGLVTDVPDVASISQWGVVMMLFVIGLELEPARLWGMRREVFGVGLFQLAICAGVMAVLMGALRQLSHLSWAGAIVCGLSLALSSTAVALRLLDERQLTRTPMGRTALGILLLQDIAAIPILVGIGILGGGGTRAPSFVWSLIAVAVVLACARLRVISWVDRVQLRELFTAGTLLVVIGSAQLFDHAGLSAGLGGFLVGVLLARSRYRDALEASIDPFKGLLLGLFFVSIGMAVNLDVVRAHWPFIALSVAALLVVKGGILYGIARMAGLPRYHRLTFAIVLAQGGEFGFAIFNEALDNGILNQVQRDVVSVVVAVSMALVPILIKVLERVQPERVRGYTSGAP
ncbi:cation:proton antiporter domain-containing protein [Bordetella genomosp. 9]|uniref:Transporter n=1 Tax=Bordetella genomosp. 9 TaxID=1416803 RepID=A0A1W6YXF4_9BORD|nr:cation:proton antiporter [Bordetella genomosp. 9]ARP85782.1 transporter [Bordetella genomosp. 9]ARP89746.1 transporter [Bordetella genomosp. 9]